MSWSWSPTCFNSTAHANDIRAVACASHGDTHRVLTASRDGSVRLWTLSAPDGTVSLTETLCLREHEGFVNSVAFLPPDAEHAQGLIVSGGADQLINVWDCAAGRMRATLIAHSGNVCKLAATDGAPFLFASSSWDGTARVWTEELAPAGSLSLAVGGEERVAVWSVAGLGHDVFVTAHADRSVKVWRGDHMVRSIASAHDDVVRDVVAVDGGRAFATVGNDGQIVLWSSDGTVLRRVPRAHAAFIYAAAGNRAGTLLATVGEEGWLRVWRVDAEERMVDLTAEIRVPMLSVWSVAFLPNDALVVGGSGGGLFVFSPGAGDSAVRDAFDSLVQLFEFSAAKQEELDRTAQDREVLTRPGTAPGQNVIVRSGGRGDDSSYEAHQWTGTEWIALGEVVSHAAPEKTRFAGDGQYYDHVFKVELDDEGRLYELPYNVGENPYVAAQSFLNRHNLPISYIDQVARFITKNASSPPSQPDVKQETESSPPKLYTVAAVNMIGVREKLVEFGLAGEPSLTAVVACLAEWPVERLFPCLDWLRVAVLDPATDMRQVATVLPIARILPNGVGEVTTKPRQAAVTMLLRLMCNWTATRPDVDDGMLVDVVGRGAQLLSANAKGWTVLLLGLVNNMALRGRADATKRVALLLNILQQTPAGHGLSVEDGQLIHAIVSQSGSPVPLAPALRSQLASRTGEEGGGEGWSRLLALLS